MALPTTPNEWVLLYNTILNTTITDAERLMRAVDIYGEWAVYEAIYVTATKKIEGDPLGYVLTVAHSKWKTSLEVKLESALYNMKLEMAKERSRQDNEDLDLKIRKARKKRGRD